MAERKSTTLERLKELEAKATPGPWSAREIIDHHNGRVECSDGGKMVELATFGCGPYDGHGLDNAALVVELRNRAPAILKALEAAEKATTPTECHDKHAGYYDGCRNCLEPLSRCKCDMASIRAALAELDGEVKG